MQREKNKHVFVSYVRENEKEVNRFTDALMEHGVNVWSDRNKIKPGSIWKDAIRQAIREGDYFIACFSKEYSSKAKSFMNEELSIALEELKSYPTERGWFIPVILSECDIPVRSIGGGETTVDIQYVALYENWERGINSILSVINPIPTEIQTLVHALDSRSYKVKMEAINALRAIDGYDVKPFLRKALYDNNINVRNSAAIALGKIKDSMAVPILVEIGSYINSEYHEEAIETLMALGEKAIQPELLKLFAMDDPSINQTISSILTKLSQEEFVEFLIVALSNKDPTIRQFAALLLKNCRELKAIEALNKALYDDNVNVQLNAIYSLGETGTNNAVLCLCEVLGEHSRQSIQIKSAAVKALGGNQTFMAVMGLHAALRHCEKNVRLAALDSLGEIGNENALTIMEVGLQDKDVIVRRHAVQILRKAFGSAAIQLLIKAIEDKDEEVQYNAVVSLGRIDNEAAVSALKNAMPYVGKEIKNTIEYILKFIKHG
ncbi:MAG: HEAT repeat domain-containing protein [Candidatus Hodarchaeota archaeon]